MSQGVTDLNKFLAIWSWPEILTQFRLKLIEPEPVEIVPLDKNATADDFLNAYETMHKISATDHMNTTKRLRETMPKFFEDIQSCDSGNIIMMPLKYKITWN